MELATIVHIQENGAAPKLCQEPHNCDNIGAAVVNIGSFLLMTTATTFVISLFLQPARCISI